MRTVEGQEIAIAVSTDPSEYRFGCEAGNVRDALINVKVSLLENPHLVEELKLPPVWVIREQDPDFPPQKLCKLTSGLKEIVPLVIAYLHRE